MNAQITYIHRTEKYVQVNLRCADGRNRTTYICPKFRNFANWDAHLEKGRCLGELIIKPDNPNQIDADSLPVAIDTIEDKRQTTLGI